MDPITLLNYSAAVEFLFIILTAVIVVGSNRRPEFFLVVSTVSVIIWFAFAIFYIWPMVPPSNTGEILRWYANGTALLDNGTLINISDIPGVGCP